MSGVVNVLIYTWCGQCPFLHAVWSMSGVVNVWCVGFLVWSMSGVVNVIFYTRFGECLVWLMFGVVNVLFLHTVW